MKTTNAESKKSLSKLTNGTIEITHIYRYDFEGNANKHIALEFRKTKEGFELSESRFHGIREGNYSLEDWEFLGLVNEKIKELLKELNK